MKKAVIIPDSFKGTLSSAEICAVMEKCIHTYYPQARLVSIPVADGGEGSVEAFLSAVGGQRITCSVKGPYMKDVSAGYALLDGETAVVEMAACAGLPLVENQLHPEKTTTFGVGQLMLDAARRGCKRIILGLGGSATNDFGAGCAAAAGIRFYDENGRAFVPVGESLSRIAHIDVCGLSPLLQACEIIAMCDIDNPLCGQTGAAYVFAPQKGADAQMVRFLDTQLAAAAAVVKDVLGKDVALLPGAGAAGGMGGGMAAFFSARLQMGIETVLDTVDFDRRIKDADIVFTGEGKLDTQSLRGKAVIGVARRCKKHGVPVIAVVGDIGDGIQQVYEEGVSAVFSINRAAIPFSEARKRSKEDLRLTMETILRVFQLTGY